MGSIMYFLNKFYSSTGSCCNSMLPKINGQHTKRTFHHDHSPGSFKEVKSDVMFLRGNECGTSICRQIKMKKVLNLDFALFASTSVQGNIKSKPLSA